MDMGITFVANFQASKRVKPCNRTLDWPARFAETTSMGRANFCEHRRDAAFSQTLPMWFGTVAPVALNDLWFMQGAPALASDIWIASTSASSWVMSCRFAALRMTASGMPCASTMRWCLLPSLRRSVGFGPVFFPPAWRELMNCPRALATNRFRRDGVVRTAAFRGCVARHLLPAMRRAVASRLCLSRIPSPAAGDSTRCLSAVRTRCPSVQHGRVLACAPHIADCEVLAQAEVVR
jgi:uncharacterized protein YjeT (DUF2065 family)